MSEKTALPSEITQGATLRGNEYAWSVDLFAGAIAKAEALGYACVGGQFQFLLEDAVCEMYWFEADSKDRLPVESWADYSRRSCSEVLKGFQRLVATTDFKREAAGWAAPIDPIKHLVFVAYFVTETELAKNTATL